MTSILYQYQKEGNLPIFDPIKFVELIESHDTTDQDVWIFWYDVIPIHESCVEKSGNTTDAYNDVMLPNGSIA